MKKPKITVGIDVSKKKLDVTIVLNPKDSKHLHFIITNDKKGIEKMLNKIKALKIDKEELLVCFEHTGVYTMPLCFVLQEKQIQYCMVPSLEIHRSRGILRGKTDKADSKMIAFYAITHAHKLKFISLPEEALMKIKVLLSERNKLVKTIGIFRKTKEVKGFLPESIFEDSLQINQQTLAFLRQQLREIDKLIQDLIKNDKVLKNKYDLATTVPGVGVQTAVYLLVITRAFTAFENWRKLACYGGMAPFEYSSGSSIRGKTKVSQLGNKKLKSILNMAALTSRKYDPQIKSYYERKINEGKNPMSVTNAIKCKLISRVFATVNRGTPYVKMEAY